MDYMKPFGCNCQNKVSQDECSRRVEHCNGRVSQQQQNECGMEQQQRNSCVMDREQRNKCAMERERRNEGCMKQEQRNECAMKREQKQVSCDKNKYESIDPLRDMPLAMAYVPWQTWRNVYDASNGLRKGTIFGELIMPFLFASPVCRDGSCGCNNGRRGDMR